MCIHLACRLTASPRTGRPAVDGLAEFPRKFPATKKTVRFSFMVNKLAESPRKFLVTKKTISFLLNKCFLHKFFLHLQFSGIYKSF